VHRALEVAHRFLEISGFVRKAGEGEVRSQPGFASLVVLQSAEEALQRLFAGGEILSEQSRAPHLQPQVSRFRRIVEDRFEPSPRIVELFFVHRDEPFEQRVAVAIVFLRLCLAPLAHEQCDALLVRQFRGCGLFLRLLGLEPIE
jgi:hypothetical protein